MDTTTHNSIKPSEVKSKGPLTSDFNTPITEVRGELSDFGIDDEEFIRDFIEKSKRGREIQNDRCREQPSPEVDEKEGIHPAVAFEKKVPSIRDNYFERKKRLFSGGWENQEHFLRLYNGNFGNYSQVAAESYLAAQFAFAFGKNKRIVAYEMEELEEEFDFPTIFAENPQHRAYVFQVVERVPYIYCEEVDLMTKYAVANELIPQKTVTVSELSNRTEVSRSHVSRVLNILETEGVAERVERENKADWWMGDAVTKNYLNGLWEAKKRLEEKGE